MREMIDHEDMSLDHRAMEEVEGRLSKGQTKKKDYSWYSDATRYLIFGIGESKGAKK